MFLAVIAIAPPLPLIEVELILPLTVISLSASSRIAPALPLSEELFNNPFIVIEPPLLIRLISPPSPVVSEASFKDADNTSVLTVILPLLALSVIFPPLPGTALDNAPTRENVCNWLTVMSPLVVVMVIGPPLPALVALPNSLERDCIELVDTILPPLALILIAPPVPAAASTKTRERT